MKSNKNRILNLFTFILVILIPISAFAIDPVSSNGRYQIKSSGGTFFIQRNGYTTATATTLSDAKKTAEDQAANMGDDMGSWTDTNGGEGAGGEGAGGEGGGGEGGGGESEGGGGEQSNMTSETETTNILIFNLLEKIEALDKKINDISTKSLKPGTSGTQPTLKKK